MELMRLIHCTLVVKSFHTEKHSLSRHLVFYNETVNVEDIREWVRSAYDTKLVLVHFLYMHLPNKWHYQQCGTNDQNLYFIDFIVSNSLFPNKSPTFLAYSLED